MTTATLTRILLNPRSTAVRRDLVDADGLHKTVMRLAPDGIGDSARQQAGILFRLDRTQTGEVLLVQSLLPPDLRHLPADYGQIDTRDLGPMLKAFTTGLQVRYRIAANASKRIRPSEQEMASGRKHGRVIPLTGEEATTWWQRKSADAGLAVHSVVASPLPAARGRGNSAPRHALTRFDGLATITDPHALTTAVLAGIGKGKPYGAGLLSLAPAHRG
ncbi:type I-E CRISPR-associated protein Cas6/Cse3/CasE [Peterkaempfera sp. SMS 1(5)a]|uniref:type I-E CRISPR-associated protein Cas6/Cse3/CasE n=1 Tax=Peterkaempfera podocarpi TaxID=3232308 RepID=UPI00366FC22A